MAHIDVKTAFYEAILAENIWLSLPAGLDTEDTRILVDIQSPKGFR